MRVAIIVRFVLCVATAALSVGCFDPNNVAAPDEILTLVASPDTIPANGFSSSQITAHISPASRSALTISFTTSVSGLTIPNGTNRGADSNGDVVVLLTSDTSPKTVIVTAEVKDGSDVVASQSVPVVFEAASASSLIKLSASSSQLEADGVSSVLMRAEINPSINPRTVTFKTTNGSFVRGANTQELRDQPAGADGVAVVPLYASTSLGSAVVTAITNGFSATQTVQFVPALPDFMTVTANPVTVSETPSTNATTLTVTLSRGTGAVTENTRVDFSIANDATGEASFGRFEITSRSSVNNGQVTVTVQYFPETAAPTGLATITARVPDNNLTARVKINITP